MIENYQALLQGQIDFTTKYQIFKESKEFTFKHFYFLKSVNPSNRALYMLKHHSNRDGYQQQKRVFSLSQIYGDYFVESCDELNYVIVKYSEIGSLMHLGQKLKTLSFNAAKFYAHKLLSQLKKIYETLHIPFRTLYVTDLIYNTLDARLMISGFGKYQNQITQRQLIYDCAEVLYYMITNSVFPTKGIKKIGEQKSRFLDKQFWNNSKKQKTYMKFMPTDQNQCQKWLHFFRRTTVKSEAPSTFDQILNDAIFQQLFPLTAVQEEIKYALLSIKAKQKEQQNRQFRLKQSIDKIKQKMQAQQCQIIKTPFLIQIVQNKSQEKQYKQEDKKQKQIKSQISFTREIKHSNSCQIKFNLVDKYQISSFLLKIFQNKLDQSVDRDVIFQENWIRVAKYEINQIQLTDLRVIFEFQICLKYFQQGDINQDPQQQFEKFQVQILFAQNKIQKEKCLSAYKINKIVSSLHQILFQKLHYYLTNGMLQLFLYSK